MLSKSNIICAILTILLAGYLTYTLIWTNSTAANATTPQAHPVRIIIDDPDSTHFITTADIARIIAPHITTDPTRTRIPHNTLSTLLIEQHLNNIDNIEHARCTRRSDDRLHINVTPMRPVARIFTPDGDTYYINRDGKHLTATPRYHTDVPIIQGDPSHLTRGTTGLLPLLDHVSRHPHLSQLITAYSIAPNGDIHLIPPIRGHVINFGTPDTDIDDKFNRLITIYRDILPVKGWDYYDTLSVKYRRQVIATRRRPRQRDPLLILDPDGDPSDNIDIGTITTGT